MSDPLVDWSAEEGEKAQRRAFELATALQLFVLLHSSAEDSMHSTAAGAVATLEACAAVLGSYLQLFQRAAAAAAAAAEGRELLQRCEVGIARCCLVKSACTCGSVFAGLAVFSNGGSMCQQFILFPPCL